MSFQKNDESDDFSMIDKKADDDKLNFSVEKLLVEEEQYSMSMPLQQKQKSQPQQQNNQIQKDGDISEIKEGSFMKDLHKWQEQLSFQSQTYNVYEESSANENPTKSFLHGKSNSHLRTTKQQTNQHTNSTFNDYGYLICDFSKPKKLKTKIDKKLKTSQSSVRSNENQCLLVPQKKVKNSLNKFFSPKIQPQRKSSNKVKLFTITNQKSKSKNSLRNSNSNASLTKQSQQLSKTNGLKSLRQMKAYSEYYGFQEYASSSNTYLKPSHIMSKGKKLTKQKIGNSNLTTRQAKQILPVNLQMNKLTKLRSKQKSVSRQRQKDITLKFKKKKT